MFSVYVIINSGVFLLMNQFYLSSLSSFGRLLNLNPTRGIGIILGVLSLGGLPPLLGFSIKFLALKCLVQKNVYLIRVLLVAGRLIRLFFYLRMAFKRSLVFFPQHSLRVFSWRKVLLNKELNFVYLVSLRSLVRVNCLGLLCLPLLVSFLRK